jgi:4-hydroxy-tetrahydrodipicolinate synthase
MSEKLFSGVGTALVTPFDGNLQIDKTALEFLVEKQIDAGVDFLVPCGTTGESPTLSHGEHIDVIKSVIKQVAGRVSILAGTGSNSTEEAVALTTGAREVGADGALVVSPYYNKPTLRGLRDYYERVFNVGLPVILYDIPSRTAREVPTELMIELANEGIIQGVKWTRWTDEDFIQLERLIAETPNDFSVLSGDDAQTLRLMYLGGDGVISVVSNLIPRSIKQLASAIKETKKVYLMSPIAHSQKFSRELLPLIKAMFIETNPIPVKTALSITYPSVFGANFRSPMCQMESENLEKLEKALADFACAILKKSSSF